MAPQHIKEIFARDIHRDIREVIKVDQADEEVTVRMKPGTSCTVGVQLLRDDVDSVEIVVLDPETDRILAKSNKIPVKLGI